MDLPQRTVYKGLILLGLIVVLGFAALWTGWQREGPPSSPRAAAPDFTLTALDGKSLALHDYRGKVVLLDFWATWCTPCREETPHFVELQRKYGGQGLQVVGVSMDDDDQPVRDFYREFRMNYPVAMGTAHLGQAYGGVLGLPLLFVIDRNGLIVAKYAGAAPLPEVERRVQALLREKD